MQSEKTSRTVILGLLLALAGSTAAVRAAEDGAARLERVESLLPPANDLERHLFDQIHDGHCGSFSLLEAGLIAGGVQRDDELQRYCRRFDALVKSLHASGSVRGEPRQRAEAIFTFLHRTLLHGGYCLQASDLRQAFDRGRFNCVTASLLLNCLAERFHLKAVALALPGHALSRLILPQETLDIETTCPEWFHVSGAGHWGTRARVTGRVPPVNGTRSVPDTLRPVSDVELVAMIYYNRGVDLLAEGRFAAAAAANLKAVRLDPKNKAARGNYLATINNWGIERATVGDYSKAAELFRLGLAADPTYAAFRDNYVRLFRQWTDKLRRDGRDEEALRLLDQAAQEQPGERFFRETAMEILRRPSERSEQNARALVGAPTVALPRLPPEY
jgi:hypothetical protein